MRRRPTRLFLLFPLTAVVLATAVPASASSKAAFTDRKEVANGEAVLASYVVVKGDGGANTISLAPEGRRLRVSDSSGVVAGKGCSQVNATTADCGAPDYTEVLAEGGDDTVTTDPRLAVVVTGAGGNDTITAGFGTITGDEGNDVLTMNAPAGTHAEFFDDARNLELEADLEEIASIRGGQGDDRLTGGPEGESLEGDEGADTLAGGAGNDSLNGAEGSDVLNGGDGSDSLDGDVAFPPPGSAVSFESDTIEGGAGNDTLAWRGRTAAVRVDLADNANPDGAEGENDRVAGVETAHTGAGADTLIGTDADETFDPGGGEDTVTGGGGIDTISYGSSSDPVTVNLGDPAPDGAPGSLDTHSGIENAAGSSRDDVLVGDDGPNALSGGDGDDRLQGGEGADRLAGDGGTDSAEGEGGADTLISRVDTLGDEPDRLDGGAAGDRFEGGIVDYSRRTVAITADARTGGGEPGEGDTYVDVDQVLGGRGDDTLTFRRAAGGPGDDRLSSLPRSTGELFGGPGADVLKADRGGELSGGSGNDVLQGGVGQSNLEGGSGRDVLRGGSGDDILDGGLGNDRLNGQGGGEDMADYSLRSARIRASTGSGGGARGEKDAYSSIEQINGGKGNDVLRGRSRKPDGLFGQGGNDHLNGLSGKDSLSGDEGRDTLIANDGQADYVHCGENRDRFRADRKDNVNVTCERRLR
jgi:Ca2+-binding RTX toxin-like protein